MFFIFARFLCRLAFPFFVKRSFVEGLQNVPLDRPVLLAANHSNSFFDAVVMGVYLQKPIHTLTRADVFRKPFVAKLLRGINLIPVFRASEGGREHLGNNDQTFDECQEIFRQNGIVIIFAEGICLNQTQLLPLKKGVARIAQRAWNDPKIGEQLVVVPVGLWYDSFTKFGKTIALRFGKPILKQNMQQLDERMARELNEKLTTDLLVLTQPLKTGGKRSFWVEIGQVINFPVNALCQYYAQKFTARTVFYDSVLFGFLLVALPIYWLLLLALCVWAF